MPSLHLVLRRGAIAFGLVFAGACGGHLSAALSLADARLRHSDSLAATAVPRVEPHLALEHVPQRIPSHDYARAQSRKPTRLLLLN